MASEIQSQNANYELTDSINNNKKVLTLVLQNSNDKKNINSNEDKENIKSFDSKKLNLLEDEHSLVNTSNVSVNNNGKNLDKRNDSDSTLVKSISSLEQNKILNVPSTITNNKATYNNNNHISNNKNSVVFENDNSNVNKNKVLNKESILLKKNSSSSFKTACSDSSISSINSFKTSKTNSSHNLEIPQNEIITSIKAQKSLKTSASAKTNNNTESGKSIKIYHIKKDKGYDINGSSASISKRYKSRNSSKELASSSQYIPNHLMLSDNNSRTSFKKEEIAQKLSLSSLSITKAHSLKKQSKAIENIIGTPIKKDHVHYILMLDMLNGIRYSVQRCNASINRELYLKDFKAKHKIALDVYNNELLPSSKYYYKFKDYAPRVFRSIREMFKISSEDYLMSLTGKYMLTEMDSPGKSGSFFYYSQDYRFIIKTVHHTEHKYLLKFLRNYYLYLKKNPNTLICKIFGLHRVKIQHGNKIHFIVMENIFPPDKDIHEKYDLKGSLSGRYTNEKENSTNKLLVLKDLNWIKRERKIYLGKEKENILMNQLEKDVKFLAENNVMDYSLLVGCHNLNKGNKDNIRDSTLSIIEPNPESLSKNIDSKRKTKNDPMAIALARAIAETEPVSLETSSSTLPETIPKRKKHFIFYHDDGGFRATDESNNDLQELYFLGIIDIFTNYNMKKKMESLCKSVINNRRSISSVNPTFYAERFLKFIRNSIGHDYKENQLRNLKPNPRQFQFKKTPLN